MTLKLERQNGPTWEGGEQGLGGELLTNSTSGTHTAPSLDCGMSWLEHALEDCHVSLHSEKSVGRHF